MEYRVNPNAVYVEVCDEYLLVAVGEARGKLPQLRKLSESGAFIWRGLEKGLASESIICAVMQEYEISRDEAQSIQKIRGLLHRFQNKRAAVNSALQNRSKT